MSQPTCAECRYFSSTFPLFKCGYCRHDPPVVVGSVLATLMSSQESIDNVGIENLWESTVFPVVEEAGWCGKFEEAMT